MPDARLVHLLRVTQDWKKPEAQKMVEDFHWLCDSRYIFLNLADPLGVRYSKVVDGDELLKNGIEIPGIEPGIPYFCVWEVLKDVGEEKGEPAPQEDKKEVSKKPSKITAKQKKDRTGRPAFTSKDLKPEVKNG